jgi:hypothetical protein
MSVTINGDTGVSKVQDGVVETADLAASVKLGKVLQVVSSIGDADPELSTTSGSYVASGSYATITPTSVGSKVLVLISGGMAQNNVSGTYIHYTVYRNGADVFANYTTTGNSVGQYSAAFSALDSPATTAALTYKVYVRSSVAGNSVQFNNHASSSCRVTLMEIAA